MNRQDTLNPTDAQVIVTDFQGGGLINEEARDTKHFQTGLLAGTTNQEISRPFFRHTMLPRNPLEVLFGFLMCC